jgi:hypothetical protein
VEALAARVVPTRFGRVVVDRLLPSPQVSRAPPSVAVTFVIMMGTELVFVTVTRSVQLSPGNSPSGQVALPVVNSRVLGPEPKTFILMDPAFRTPESASNVVNTANVPEPRRLAAAPIMRRLSSMLRFI